MSEWVLAVTFTFTAFQPVLGEAPSTVSTTYQRTFPSQKACEVHAWTGKFSVMSMFKGTLLTGEQIITHECLETAEEPDA